MQRKVDLHVHTYFSDGTFSPEEIVKQAQKLDLVAISICDHDCVDGIEKAINISRKLKVEIIPGVETTSEKKGVEIHILGYFIDIKSKPLVEMLTNLKNNRIKRIYNMVERLREHNINISPETVFCLSNKGTIGRLHLARALYNEGLVSSIKEAFTKYIGDHAPCYIRGFNISPEEAIGCILKAGGVPVYAHPKVMGSDDFIPDFIKAGLRGIEVYHTDHTKTASGYYLNLARKFGLLVTGGSDCHGYGKGKVLMGRVSMPYSVVEELKKEQKDISRTHAAIKNE